MPIYPSTILANNSQGLDTIDIDWNVSPSAGNYTLVAESGAVGLTGSPATLTHYIPPTDLDQVTGLTPTVYKYNQISLTWDPVVGAEWYDIDVQDPAGRWNHLRSVTAAEVDMAGFSPSTQYSFRVRAAALGWPNWMYGPNSATVSPTTGPYQASPDYTVTDDASWDTAYANAGAGDVIEIAVGTVLTHKTCPPWRFGAGKFLTIRSASYLSLPPFDQRATASDIANMPTFRVTQPNLSGFDVTSGRHHVTLEGIRLRAEYDGSDRVNFIVRFNGDLDYANDPYNIEFHRCYVDSPVPAPPFNQCDDGLWSYGSSRVVVKDCSFIELTGNISDTQAIGGSRGDQWSVNNCYLEGGAENILLGGSSHSDTDYNSNLWVIRRNHFKKPLYWKSDDPSYDGYARVIKNLLELKVGVQIFVEDNFFENHWTGGQQNCCVLTPRGPVSAQGPEWCRVSHVRMRYNRWFRMNGGLMASATDDLPLEFVHVEHNLWEDNSWGGPGTIISFGSSASGDNRFENYVYNRNTMVTDYPHGAVQQNSPINAYTAWPDGKGVGGTYEMRGNIFSFFTYGIKTDGGADGITGLEQFNGVGNTTWVDNLWIGTHSRLWNETDYPTSGPYSQFKELTYDDVGFENWPSNDWRLRVDSPYYGTQGADVAAVYARTANCESGDWST